ncbi:hypothetical protein Pla108_24560 [Botrimarina colliarenosi]|uniref:Uncharacterized protein n=1 Tax=Botrimarina colliarenosi TaxID=2528001 RepID=A0A5C6A9J6_9BACT|nr:hypothetical protein [Botrimarina colliarenosi]TWT96682.1 hypothetical protein Pla108_24560 [Botrimarina colliarenosi]
MPRLPLIVCSLGLAALLPGLALGQFTSAEATPSSAPAAAPRDFAPGVETVIPPSIDPAETVTQHDVVEIRANEALDWQPKLLADQTLYQDAEDTRFTREIWCLEFGFKPLRMIRFADPSTESGQRFVWYLVYRVKNTGAALKPTMSEADGEFTAVAADSGPIRYLPHFVLQGHDVGPEGGKVYRAYLDQSMPEAVAAIGRREAPGRKLYTSTTMPLEPLAVGEERWGVALWSDIDPEIDFFSVYARGLSNAYEWTDPAGAYAAGDPPGKGREFVRKTLQLNFWRPGDRFLQHENEVRYGTAPGKADLYGVEEGVDYRWVYR